jgi:hypothetical protein
MCLEYQSNVKLNYELCGRRILFSCWIMDHSPFASPNSQVLPALLELWGNLTQRIWIKLGLPNI